MHVRQWAALSGVVLFTLIALSLTFLWLCAPAVWKPDFAQHWNFSFLRITAGVFCVVTAVFAVALARIACTRFPLPQGVSLHRIDAPKLWAEVDRVAVGLGAPRIHHIVVNDGVSAAICSRRSWLLFSWRNYLVLGLPLLRALPPEEMRAVIAHEIAHLLQGDTILGRAVYRAHALWGTLDRLATRRPSGMLERAIHRTTRYGRALSRRHRLSSERAADAACLRITSASVTARALVRSAVAGRQLTERVRAWVRTAHAEGVDIPDDFVERLDSFLDRIDDRADGWLAQELLEKTGPSDRHPCLRERLRALTGSAEAQLPAPITERESSASAWLGTLRWSVAHALSVSWKRRHTKPWRSVGATVRDARQQAEALQSRLPTLDAEDLRHLAALRASLGDRDALRPVLERILCVEPDDAMSHMKLAELLLERDDSAEDIRARGLLDRAAELRPDLDAECLTVLASWHARCGRPKLARRTLERAAGTDRKADHA